MCTNIALADEAKAALEVIFKVDAEVCGERGCTPTVSGEPLYHGIPLFPLTLEYNACRTQSFVHI